MTLDLYAYVENGPVNRVDASGHVTNTGTVGGGNNWSDGERGCGPLHDDYCDDPEYVHTLRARNTHSSADAGIVGAAEEQNSENQYEAMVLAASAGQVAVPQQNPNQVVGNTTESSLANVLTNEDGSISTPNKGAPDELVDGKTALANAIYNNASLPHPEKVAPD